MTLSSTTVDLILLIIAALATGITAVVKSHQAAKLARAASAQVSPSEKEKKQENGSTATLREIVRHVHEVVERHAGDMTEVRLALGRLDERLLLNTKERDAIFRDVQRLARKIDALPCRSPLSEDCPVDVDNGGGQ